MGSAYGFGGLGKILGPLMLAVFAGAENVVSPEATITAVKPAFLFLGALAVAAGLVFWFGIETRGKTLKEIDSILLGEPDDADTVTGEDVRELQRNASGERREAE